MPVRVPGDDTAGGSDAGFVAALRSRVRNEGDGQAALVNGSSRLSGQPVQFSGGRKRGAGQARQQATNACVQRCAADAVGQRGAQEPLAAPALTGTKVNCSSLLRKVPRATGSVAGFSITENTQSVVFTAYQRLEPWRRM